MALPERFLGKVNPRVINAAAAWRFSTKDRLTDVTIFEGAGQQDAVDA
jgi:hypothetical protein